MLSAGLDWRARKELVSLLANLKKQLSLLIVSHDLRELAPIVDMSWEMQVGGELQAKGKDLPITSLTAT